MAMQTFNDELEDLTPATPTATTAKATSAAAAAPAPTPKATPAKAAVAADDEDNTPTTNGKVDDNENLDTDFDDDKVFARPGQIDQCRPEKGKAARFCFVPKEWIAPQTAKGHFVETGSGKEAKKGRYRCLTTLGTDADPQYCCVTLDEDGEVTVVALVIRYTNANPETGKYTKTAEGTFQPVEFSIQWIRLSQFNMRQIKKLPDEDSNPFSIDIVMTHADRAYGYEFNRASNSPRWLSDATTKAAVQQATKKFLDGKALRSKLGAKLNETEWKVLLSGKKLGSDSKIENVEEL